MSEHKLIYCGALEGRGGESVSCGEFYSGELHQCRECSKKDIAELITENEALKLELKDFQWGASVEAQAGDEARSDANNLRKDAERLRWLRHHEFDIGSYHGVHEHNAAAWFESVSDEDIDSMIADEEKFAKESGHE